MKKITITKGFLWVKAGTELTVYSSTHFSGEKYIEISRIKGSTVRNLVIYLSEIEGWYEWVTWKPGHREAYRYINPNLTITTIYEAGRVAEDLQEVAALVAVGNCFPATMDGLNEAESMVEKMIQLFNNQKEGM